MYQSILTLAGVVLRLALLKMTSVILLMSLLAMTPGILQIMSLVALEIDEL